MSLQSNKMQVCDWSARKGLIKHISLYNTYHRNLILTWPLSTKRLFNMKNKMSKPNRAIQVSDFWVANHCVIYNKQFYELSDTQNNMLGK